MKNYILVVASILLTIVALPAPASALYCFPDAPEVSDELRCHTQFECNGDLAWTCNVVGGALDDAIDAVEYVEDTADNLGDKVHPEVEIRRP